MNHTGSAYSRISRVLLFMLALLFSAGLIFATVELPALADQWIQDNFHFPGYDQQASTLHISKADLYFRHFHLRFWGYASLIILFILVITGLVTNRLKLSVLSAFALFIPIFGHFTVTMFFLAGLGFLRFLWIPLTEISRTFMHLGDILLLPHHWLIKFGERINVDLHFATSIFFIASGVIIFVFGVFAWLHTKFNKGQVVHSRIYKLSRHPQYLGWIIWSYGLFLLPVEAQKRSWSYPDSLPLLLTIMIIILISFFEEFKMKKKYGNEYMDFKSKTAFMFPLPEWLKRIIKHPLKLFYGNYKFDSKDRAVFITLYYTVILMLASYLYLGFTQPALSNKLAINRHREKISEYMAILQESRNKRQKDLAAMSLESYGKLAVDPLLDLMRKSNPATNIYVVRTLGEIGDIRACQPVYDAFKNQRIEPGYEMIMAVGKLKCTGFEEVMLKEITNPESKVKSYAAWYLGQTGSLAAVELLLNNYSREEPFTQVAYLEALGNIRDPGALPLLIDELQNDDSRLVEAAIIALSKLKAVEAVNPLKQFPLRSLNWEIRIYADEAIKQIMD